MASRRKKLSELSYQTQLLLNIVSDGVKRFSNVETYNGLLVQGEVLDDVYGKDLAEQKPLSAIWIDVAQSENKDHTCEEGYPLFYLPLAYTSYTSFMIDTEEELTVELVYLMGTKNKCVSLATYKCPPGSSVHELGVNELERACIAFNPVFLKVNDKTFYGILKVRAVTCRRGAPKSYVFFTPGFKKMVYLEEGLVKEIVSTRELLELLEKGDNVNKVDKNSSA